MRPIPGMRGSSQQLGSRVQEASSPARSIQDGFLGKVVHEARQSEEPMKADGESKDTTDAGEQKCICLQCCITNHPTE
jgi:hypothetical protein